MAKAKRRRTWMRRHARAVTPGAPPGQLIGTPGAPLPPIRAVGYGPDGLEECEIDRIDRLGELDGMARRHPVIWVDVGGIADVSTIQAIGQHFDLHPLALEDVANVGQRAKVEPYDEYLFIVLRVPTSAEDRASEQISLFLGRNFVVTFQEALPDPFEAVRARVRGGKGRLRRLGPDYLAYALIDAAIDAYFPVLDRLASRLEEVEIRAIRSEDRGVAGEIHEARSELLNLHRDIWPYREALGSLLREPGELIGAETAVFLRDCYDHNAQLIDLVQTYREVCSDLMNVHLSTVSNRMNEVMKVLTIIATIFIPLSFIAGVYGMNFDPAASAFNMPELHWRWGYPFALGLMLAVALGLLAFFRRKGWL